jgi:phosphorylase kinase gamma subunit
MYYKNLLIYVCISFQAAIIVAMATYRIQKSYHNPPPISLEQMKKSPYSSKAFRKLIDGCAFRVYGHWVKKGEDQNRAALFEMQPKTDLQSPSENGPNFR